MIRRALKTNLNAKVIATGCFSQITPDEVKKLSNRCYAVGNKEKIKTTIDIIESDAQPDTSFTGVEYENYTLDKPTRAREYIKIQDGCEGKCAYCIIPEARGPIRSKPADTVIEEVKALTEQGVKEIILTGIEISSYQYGLAHILKEINNIEKD